MYRNQQSLYSNQIPGGNLSRKPDTTSLYEDSPDLNQRMPGLLFPKEMPGPFPRYQDSQHAMYHQPQQQQLVDDLNVFRLPRGHFQNAQQQPLSPLTNNYTQQPLSGFKGTASGVRLNQSEESGGLLHTHEDANVEDFEEDQMDELREGENDIEYIIMNLYSKMKNLENKYIDLANFYKQEWVKSSANKKGNTIDEDNQLYGGQSQQHRSGGISSPGSYGMLSPKRTQDKVLEAEQSPGKDSPARGGNDLPSERQIINDLIEEKKKLEDDLKQMIALRGSFGHQPTQSSHHQQSPAKFKVSDFKANVPTQEQLQFLKQQLVEALSDVIENLDNTQKKELHYLSNKQNEMYQLASRYQLQPQIKNESLGLWYDAKTKVSSLMSELRNFVQNKQKHIENNLVSGQMPSDRGGECTSLRDQLEMMNKSNANMGVVNSKMLDDFKKELQGLKRKQETYQKNVQKLKSQMKFKEGLLREEQGKLNQIIRDLKHSLSNQEDANRRLLSGERYQNQQVMSPFERKIATYQKSAERRKERSGSRGRPLGAPMSNTGSNFYQQSRDVNLLNMQTIHYQQKEQDQDLRSLRNKVKNFELHFGEFSSKLMLKNQDIQELERFTDSNLHEQHKYINQVEQLINYYASTNKQAEKRTKSKSRINDLTTSPAASANYSTSSKEHERRLAELQRNNEQIYQELRKANEKYLNQRVENNKLKDEIQILQNAVEDAQTQIRKLQNSSVLDQSQQLHGSRQKITSKTRPSRYEGTQNHPYGQTQQRQHSNTSNHMARENEELKRRVQELEKECFSLTYYQQELQRRGTGLNSDPYVRTLNQENGELKNKLDQLCLQVQKFMLAMRRLQRAVNNKDKDIQNLKQEFEKNKKLLDIMVKEIKEKDEKQNAGSKYGNLSGFSHNQPGHHSMMTGYGRDPRFGNESQERMVSTSMGGIKPVRNRSQAPKELNQSAGFSSRPQQYPITQRPYGFVEDQLNHSNSLLPPKKGVIRPKQHMQTPDQQNQQFKKHSTPQPFNQNTHPYQQQHLPTEQTTDQQEHFNQLLEEVKSMTEERDQLRKQIEELKVKCEQESIQRNKAEAQNQLKDESLDKLNDQLQQANEKIYKLEKMINEYKEGLHQLEQEQNLNQLTVSKIKTDLLYKEKDLISQAEIAHKQTFIPFGSQSIFVQTTLTGEIEDKTKMEKLKSQLIQLVQEKEQDFEKQLSTINSKLTEKEEDLNAVKKLFMEKLKELESSFVELSQDMIESEQVQVEVSRRYQQQQQQQQKQQQMNIQEQQKALQEQQELEKSIEQIISDGGAGKDKYEEELQEQIDSLTQLNEQLQEENGELRQIMKQLQKDLTKQEELLIYKAQYEDIQEHNEQLEQRIHDLQSELDKAHIQSSQNKQHLEKVKKELSEATKTKEKAISTYQAQMDELNQQIQEVNVELRQEQEQRVFYESEYHKLDKAMKALQSEMRSIEEERDCLVLRETELEKLVESLKEEVKYVQSLKQGDFSVDSVNASDTQTSEIGPDADLEEQQRIDNDPKEAANHFLRLLKATKKEFKIMTNNRDKLQNKYDEMKEKFDTLKQESRTNVEEIMNMETKIFDLTSQNERLQNELEKAKGDYKVEEELIRKEVEDYFRERLNYKDSEIEQMTQKVARISQTNIELTNKSNRLESNLTEVLTENEALKNQLQTLEMELEMTKVNNERDIEQLQQQKTEQQQLIDQQLVQMQEEKKKLEEKVEKKRQKLHTERARLNEEVERAKASGNENVQQVMDELQKQHEQKLKATEEELLSKQSEALQLLQERLQSELDQSLSRKDKERLLIVKLQQHVKKCLEQELQRAIELNQQREQEMKTLREQYENEKKELEELRVKELQLLEQKLKQESVENEKKIKKERTLVQVLQMKARQCIIKELEKEKEIRLKEQEEAKNQIEQLINEKEKELEEQEKHNQQRIEEIQQQLQEKAEQEQEEIKNQLQQELDELQSNSSNQLQLKQQEIERLKQEQEELVRSLSEQQDQQTKDLLNQKEREKEQLKIEMERMKQELENKYKKDIDEKEKQSKMMLSMQEKLRSEIETRLQESVSKLEQTQIEREQELAKLQEEHENALQILEGKSLEEQTRIRQELEKSEQEKLRVLQEKEQELQNAKEQQEKALASIQQKKQEELENLQQQLQSQIDTLTSQVNDQQAYIQQLEQQVQTLEEDLKNAKQDHDNQIQTQKLEIEQKQREIDELMGEIEELKVETKKLQDANLEVERLTTNINELEEMNKELQKQLEDLNEKTNQKDKDFESLKQTQQELLNEIEEQRNEELQSLKTKLEQEHQELLQKKDQERTLIEKMQDKIREELTSQINEKEQERLGYLERLNQLEQDIKDKEKDFEQEQQKAQNRITELESQLEDTQQQLEEKTNALESLEEELDQLKKAQSESENQQIKDLTDQVNMYQSQYQQLLLEKEEVESEKDKLNAQLQQKTKEIENLENDLQETYKEIEEERQRNEEEKVKNLETLNKVNEQLQSLQDAKEKDKKDNEMQLKMKESLLKKLQDQLEENEKHLELKQSELDDESERRQKQKKRVQELEAQLKSLKDQHEEEIDQLQSENTELKEEIEQLKKKNAKLSNNTGKDNEMVNQSIDEIKGKIGDFNVQLKELKKQHQALEKQKQLNDSLIENAEKNVDSEIIGDINSDAVQFCKRVKYLDQAWFLISKSNDYFWVNQSKIPVDKLQKIDVQEIEQTQSQMEEKLKELQNQKEQLTKLIQRGSPQQTTANDNAQVKALEIEVEELKAQNNEYHLANVALQQNTLQLKARINELNDMIFGLAESDKSHENISKIVDLHKKKEKLSNKLLEQIEITQKLESENEQLRKQLQEQEYSFAKGGKSFAVMKPENFDLNTSSIDHKLDDDVMVADPQLLGNPQVLREKVERLETELEEFHRLHAALEFQNQSLKGELQQLKASQSNASTQQQAEAQEALENIKHIKNLFIKFLEKVPIMQAGSGEELLPVILSMMMLTKEEQSQLQKAREQITQQKMQETVKKGVISGFFGKKK